MQQNGWQSVLLLSTLPWTVFILFHILSFYIHKFSPILPIRPLSLIQQHKVANYNFFRFLLIWKRGMHWYSIPNLESVDNLKRDVHIFIQSDLFWAILQSIYSGHLSTDPHHTFQIYIWNKKMLNYMYFFFFLTFCLLKQPQIKSQ